MGIIKEFSCKGHGPFEAEEPICPRGCTAGVSRQFRTPTSISTGGRTRGIDQSLERIAKEFGLSDMNNHGGTTAARVANPKQAQFAAAQEAIRRKYPKPWGAVPTGGKYEVGAGVIAGNGPGALGALAQHGASGAVDVKGMMDTFPKRQVEKIISKSDAEITAKAMKAA